MHLRDDKVYIPAHCKESTLFVYDITDDSFDNVYIANDNTVHTFTDVYFLDTQIYFSGSSYD